MTADFRWYDDYKQWCVGSVPPTAASHTDAYRDGWIAGNRAAQRVAEADRVRGCPRCGYELVMCDNCNKTFRLIGGPAA